MIESIGTVSWGIYAILQEEQTMSEVIKKVSDEELNLVSGGRGGSGESICEVQCPGCGHVYKIKDQTVKINCSCGTSFYPTAR